MLYRNIVLVFMICVASLAVPAVRSGPAHAEGPALPAPTGQYAVGRTDTTVAAPDREVPVSVWYPAAEAGRPASYIPASRVNAAGIATRAAQWLYTPAAAGPMVTATVPATLDATPAALPSLPVVVWSPGLGTPRWLASGLAGDLASRGYAVVALDHPGETPGAEASGRVLRGEMPSQDPAYLRTALAHRVEEVRLVLDGLGALPLVGDRLDTARVAVAGHSYGGQTAVSVAADDPRIRTAVVLDGSAGWDDVAEVPPMPHPVLLLASGNMVHASWTGTGAVIGTIAGAGHYTATDLPVFGGSEELCGRVDAAHAATLTRSVVAAWLDRHLLGGYSAMPEDDPLLRWRVR
ncbi:alpha/beta hydrolase [Nocardia sp. NPDC024068]|uniref:alpha/beta hydrolase family protein n=1 Tax=Nocardia sp. NPDC024068 TaxID=3157197 RepID=UPI00340C2C5A